jgi:hypothetical protein
MTDNEINKAIAEFRGWENIEWSELGEYFGKPPANYRGRHTAWLPSFTSDLNEMYKVEQMLWDRDWSSRATFVDHLARILNPVHGYHKQDGIDLLDATARDRAEAFVKTIGAWKSEEGVSV